MSFLAAGATMKRYCSFFVVLKKKRLLVLKLHAFVSYVHRRRSWLGQYLKLTCRKQYEC